MVGELKKKKKRACVHLCFYLLVFRGRKEERVGCVLEYVCWDKVYHIICEPILLAGKFRLDVRLPSQGINVTLRASFQRT